MSKPFDGKKADKELAIVHKKNEGELADAKGLAAKMELENKRLINELKEVGIRAGKNSILVEGDLPERRIEILPQDEFGRVWDELVIASRQECARRGIPLPESSSDLLSHDEQLQIIERLERPIWERMPWDRYDYLTAFAGGVVGSAIDILLATPGHFAEAMMADKNTRLGSWMERIHSLHADGAPIDYQGAHFGGGFHRGLSPGHDLLRPLEGIRQFRDGVFRGAYYKDGVKYVIESSVNQFGKAYEKRSYGDAVCAWAIHMFCDFFSSASLPIPGTSWVRECSSRELRVFVQNDLYQSGINLRHLTLQTLAPLVTEIGVSSYMIVRYSKSSSPSSAIQQKKIEMLTLGHALTTAINMGKVVVLEDPTRINVPAILALMNRLNTMILLEDRRTSLLGRILRNNQEIFNAQLEIEQMLDSTLETPIFLGS